MTVIKRHVNAPLSLSVLPLVLCRANKSAYASVFIMIALWFAFRFLGPALGLYKLADF